MRPEALLILGPTGSGKTPLGAYMEKKGLAGRSCCHFDFGEQLRTAAARGEKGVLSAEALKTVQESLKTGTLLEKETFYIAEALFRAFILDGRDAGNELVVLNGIPRHMDQAADMDRLVRLKSLVVLKCSARVALERIRTNSGGDRVFRDDDELGDVSRRLKRYRLRTRPLIHYYRGRGVPVITAAVKKLTRPDQIVRELEAAHLFLPGMNGLECL